MTDTDTPRADLAAEMARAITALCAAKPWRFQTPREHADAILRSGVLDRIRADAWDEGAAAEREYADSEEAHYHGVQINLPPREPNPYRAEGA